MGGMGLFGMAMTCLAAGYIASATIGRPRSVFANLTAGVIGAFIGELAAQALDIPSADSFLGVLMAASVGAALLLSPLALFRRRPKP